MGLISRVSSRTYRRKKIKCNKMKFIHLISILISILISPTSCFGGYSQEELDLFDLYDELRHTTFYKFLSDPSKNIDLNPKSTKKEIKSAYKKKALKWHPDKWKQENEEDAKIDTRKGGQTFQATLSNQGDFVR